MTPNYGPASCVNSDLKLIQYQFTSAADSFARDRFMHSGLDVAMDIGQHPNDKMISFYGKTPSGFHIEFGFGGVVVDDATWQPTRYDVISQWGHRPAAPFQPATPAKKVK